MVQSNKIYVLLFLFDANLWIEQKITFPRIPLFIEYSLWEGGFLPALRKNP